MNRIIMLGTGHAMVTKCYNTCFLIEHNSKCLLVDTGGGNKILEQLEKVNIDINQIHDIFITHNHFDHMVGLFWIIRLVNSKIRSNTYDGILNIYITNENAKLVKDYILGIYGNYMGKYIGNKIVFINIEDGMKIDIIDNSFEVIDLHSWEGSQFGFKMICENRKTLSYFGDLPYNSKCKTSIIENDYIIHEAFCLDSQKDIFKPHEKHHSTVKDACEIATELKAKNIILVHTEDSDIENKKNNYIYEGRNYFDGNIIIPNDLEIIDLI